MTLHALSPLDGRYENEISPLRDFFSEFAFFRARARLELDFLAALANTGILPVEALSGLKRVLSEFTEEDARRIQEYEKTTRHDVKAIEYFLRDKIEACHSELSEESPANEQETLRHTRRLRL